MIWMAGYERLRKSTDFSRVMKEGRLLKGSLLLIRSAPGLEGITRIGYAVSKKHGNSVKRNRIKRVFREAARAAANLPESTDMVFVPRSAMDSSDIKTQDVTRELERLLSEPRRNGR